MTLWNDLVAAFGIRWIIGFLVVALCCMVLNAGSHEPPV